MKLLTLMALVLLSVSTQAKEIERVTYEAVCMQYTQLLEVVDTFGEIPLAQGISVPIGKPNTVLSTVIFVNPDTKSFTVAERVTDDRYCVLVLGHNFGPVPDRIQKDFREKNDKRKL